MQRLVIAFAIAAVVLAGLVGFAVFGGDEDSQAGPVDLQPLGATHVPGEGIEIRVGNLGSFDFEGNVTLRLTQDTAVVTTTVRLTLPAGGQAAAVVPPPRGRDDWDVAAASPPFEVVVDPREEIEETRRDNNTMVFVCFFEGSDCDGD